VAQPELEDAEHVRDDLVLLLQHGLHAGRTAADVHHQLVEEDFGAATRVEVVPVHVLVDLCHNGTNRLVRTASQPAVRAPTYTSADLAVFGAPRVPPMLIREVEHDGMAAAHGSARKFDVLEGGCHQSQPLSQHELPVLEYWNLADGAHPQERLRAGLALARVRVLVLDGVVVQLAEPEHYNPSDR
jgi:hypothetical protein